MVLVQSNFHKQKTSTTLSMLSDGKNWIAMPASFMASQSWKDSLHQKKNGRISEEIRLKFLVLIASCLITVQV